MPVLNFQLTGNEDYMLRFAFNAEHDISLNHEYASQYLKRNKDCFEGYYRFQFPISKVVRSALSYSGNRVIDPKTFVRVLNREDKGTPDSPNWPHPGNKYNVRLTDQQHDELCRLASLYFIGNKTYTVVWLLRNLSALLATDNDLLGATRHPSRLSDTNSRKVNVRLPNDVMAYYESIRAGESLGKRIREAVLRDYTEQIGGATVVQPETIATVPDDEDFLDEFETL